MKRMLFGLVVFILVALSGCVTYRSFDENENRQLSHDQVFKKASSASNFTIANDSTGWGIRLAYVDTFDAYDVTKYGSFKINYRQLSVVAPLQAIKGQSGDARPVGDKEKLNESETKEWSTETLSQKNAKIRATDHHQRRDDRPFPVFRMEAGLHADSGRRFASQR